MDHPAQGSDAHAPIDEGLFAPINGADQWVTIRGRDRGKPVLMILGGPGTVFTRLTPLFAPWERDFVVVQWNQPSDATLSLGRLVRDAAAVIEFARARLGAAKVVVLGVSGGSVIGLMLAARRPDLLSAYVGTGQFVDYARQDALSYAMIAGGAEAQGAAQVFAELQALGPPPWPDAASDEVLSKYSGSITTGETAALTAVAPQINAPPAGARYIAPDLAGQDLRARVMKAYAAVRDELKDFDARRLGLTFEVPILFIQGANDLYSVTSEVETYANEIIAPHAAITIIEGGGHSCVFMSEVFLAHLNTILAEAWAKQSRP